MLLEHCCPGVRQPLNGTPSGLPFQPHEQATRHPGEHRCTRHRHARTIGDPLTDVALMCVYRNPALDVILWMPAAWTSPRLPSPDALAEAYARRSGRDLSAWPFYEALAPQLAVIAEGISHRAQAGADAGRDAARAAEAVPPLVAAGLTMLGKR